MYAARSGQAGCVKVLLEKGASPNAQTQNGKTALLMAIDQNGKKARILHVVKVLLDGKADVELADHSGMNPLTCALKHKHIEIAQLLVNSGQAQVNLNDLLKNLPTGHENVVRAFVNMCHPALSSTGGSCMRYEAASSEGSSSNEYRKSRREALSKSRKSRVKRNKKQNRKRKAAGKQSRKAASKRPSRPDVPRLEIPTKHFETPKRNKRKTTLLVVTPPAGQRSNTPTLTWEGFSYAATLKNPPSQLQKSSPAHKPLRNVGSRSPKDLRDEAPANNSQSPRASSARHLLRCTYEAPEAASSSGAGTGSTMLSGRELPPLQLNDGGTMRIRTWASVASGKGDRLRRALTAPTKPNDLGHRFLVGGKVCM